MLEMRALEPHLVAIGVDPLVSEVARLTASETNPNVRFVEAFAVSDQPLPQTSPDGPHWFSRSSAWAAVQSEARKDSYVQDNFNAGAPVAYTERRITLSKLLEDEGMRRVDVLKVDTDGFDVQVLAGADRFLRDNIPLLVIVEANFNGEGLGIRSSSVIWAVDAILRPLNLSLVDMDVWRYTRAALPAPFVMHTTSQTVRGPLGYCDVYYYDDPLAEPGKLDRWLQRGDLQRCFKLIILFERFGLQDCAAELICALQDHELAKDAANWTEMLDLLVPPNPMGLTRYAQYAERFRNDPRSFLPSRWGRAPEIPEGTE
jgi:FkbM family methyltransferase